MLTLPLVSVDNAPQVWTGHRPPPEWLALVNRHALVTRLLSTTVHDVNNILQVVSGAAEVLAMDPTREAVARRTDSIVGQARQATATLQALTEFARDPGNSAAEVRIKALVEQAVALRLHALRQGRVAVIVAGDEAAAFATPARLLQTLLNLLVNAEQALAGRAGATLTIQVDGDADWVTITVGDNGPGLTDAAAAALYAWPPGPGRAPDRLGIGLLVARDLVSRDGGTLTYAPVATGGAVFRVSVPRD